MDTFMLLLTIVVGVILCALMGATPDKKTTTKSQVVMKAEPDHITKKKEKKEKKEIVSSNDILPEPEGFQEAKAVTKPEEKKSKPDEFPVPAKKGAADTTPEKKKSTEPFRTPGFASGTKKGEVGVNELRDYIYKQELETSPQVGGPKKRNAEIVLQEIENELRISADSPRKIIAQYIKDANLTEKYDAYVSCQTGGLNSRTKAQIIDDILRHEAISPTSPKGKLLNFGKRHGLAVSDRDEKGRFRASADIFADLVDAKRKKHLQDIQNGIKFLLGPVGQAA